MSDEAENEGHWRYPAPLIFLTDFADLHGFWLTGETHHYRPLNDFNSEIQTTSIAPELQPGINGLVSKPCPRDLCQELRHEQNTFRFGDDRPAAAGSR